MKRACLSDYSIKKVVNNDDLLNKILVGVPARSLIRFKCVSKHWLSLISDSKFENDHLCKHENQPFSGIYIDSRPLINFKTKLSTNGQQSIPKLNFLRKSFGAEAMIEHSCNGLMLCSCGPEIIVCNLTTQKFKRVPPIHSHLIPSRLNKFIAFYPTKSLHYKVVFIHCSSQNDIFDIYIYSSDNGLWNKKYFNCQGINPFTCKVLCDGAIYWMARDETLLQFDIDNENLTIINFPSEPLIFEIESTVLYFGEYGGRLLLIQHFTDDFQILELDIKNSRWTLKYEDITPECLHLESDEEKYGNVLCLLEGDEEEIPILLLACEGIILCNPMNDLPQYLQDLHSEVRCKMGLASIRANKFIESLASV